MMDSFELNKLLGAALGTVFVVFSLSLISEGLFHSEAPETPGYAIAEPEPAEGAEGGGAAAEVDVTQEIFPLLASADAAAGEALFKRCAACHTIESGGPNKIGPNLHGVLGRPIASHEGFAYSAAMKEFSQGSALMWDWDHITHFIHGPKGYVPGTAMSFAGLKKPDELANLLAYLNTQGDAPLPLPEATAAPAAEGAAAPAPAEGAAPAPAEGAAPAPASDAAAPAPATDGQAAPATPAPTSDAPAPAADGQAAPAAPAGDAATPAAPDAGTSASPSPATDAPAVPAAPATTPPANQ